MTTKELADILFPDVMERPEDFEKRYPPRKLLQGAEVTRFGASPTGYINIGGLYTAFISWKIAKMSNGKFILRIEDNNQRDLIDDGIKNFVNALTSYDISFDEGYIDTENEIGGYGPYIQSKRQNIYQVYVKELVSKGFAYPCFCSVEKLEGLRELQRTNKEQTGYYGKYAECRNLSPEVAAERALMGESFVIRLRAEYLSDYTEEYYDDLIKGKVRLSKSDLDLIILKESGLPDYHFAHVVDDHLMGTTIITRCEDWLPSLHTHLALFSLMGWKPPRYAHIGALSIKLNERSIVKISKKLGDAVTVDYYLKKGYTPEAFKAYFAGIASNISDELIFENKVEDSFSLSNMSSHGAIFDIAKLNYVSKFILEKNELNLLERRFSQWIAKYHPELFEIITCDEKFLSEILRIIRGVEAPRRSVACCEDILKEVMPYFNAPHKGSLIDGDLDLLKGFMFRIRERELENIDAVRTLLTVFANEQGVSLKRIAAALRRMIVGSDYSPSVFEMVMIFGLNRIGSWIKELDA